jgi:3'(2'), 5'-bisphosphate nucleotidase
VEGGKFLLGFIYVPILDILYYSDYQNSYKIINVQDAKILKKDGNDLNNGIIQISSLGRGEQKILLEEFKSLLIKKNIHSASSYKFCLIAEGVADFYPRRGNMKIWDVAAAFGILKFLNYQFLDLEGNEITLQTMIKDFSIPSFNLFRSKEVVDYIKINLLNSFNSSSE